MTLKKVPPLSFPIMGGVDKKIAGFVVPSPRLQTVENAFASKTGSLQRRFGRTALSSSEVDATVITGWKALGKYKERLLGFTSSKGYEYSETLARWADRGTVASMRVSLNGVTKSDARDSF